MPVTAPTHHLKIASLFSGIGGFEKGLLQVDPTVEIVFSSEIDKYARQIYKKNFGVEPRGDITQIDATNVPDHDILCGGFPCQAFSIAGKRRGFEDTRGTLFFEIMRIAEAKRPKLLFLENVRGLLSHDEGRTFQTILRSMDELGYDTEWQVFNSKNHGVPQNRERVFIIGHIRGGCTRQIFPITASNISDKAMEEPNKSITQTLTARGAGEFHLGMILLCDSGQGRKDQLRRDVIPPLRANTGAGHNNLVVACGINMPSRGAEPRKDGLSTTIKITRPNPIYDGQMIRRLMPVECERLQGFPDGWTATGIDGGGNEVVMSDTQRYKCLGNAVTVNVVEFIAGHIIEMLNTLQPEETQ